MCMYLFTYAFTLFLTSLPSCMHVYVYVCVFMFVYLCMYVYVCIYVRLHPLLDLLTILRHNVITSNSASSYSIHTPVILQILFLFIHLSQIFILFIHLSQIFILFIHLSQILFYSYTCHKFLFYSYTCQSYSYTCHLFDQILTLIIYSLISFIHGGT